MDIEHSLFSGQILVEGIEYYKKYKNIQMVDVPYIIPNDINYLTCPPNTSLTNYNENKSYVGSAEQSFLYLVSKQLLLKKYSQDENNYMAITPCIRDEIQDETHLHCFVKLELFSFNEEEYINFMNYATSFFNRYLNVYIEKTPVGYDINSIKHNIELGSYGKRTVIINNEEITYSYGTAFAEPRLSYAIQKQYM